MDATAGGAQVAIFLHQIDQQLDSEGLEINVTVKCQKVSVFSHHFFSVHGYGQLHETVTEKVVHVHDLKINPNHLSTGIFCGAFKIFFEDE
jgi:hypothetical protein